LRPRSRALMTRVSFTTSRSSRPSNLHDVGEAPILERARSLHRGAAAGSRCVRPPDVAR
jgi:hypothetical protein